MKLKKILYISFCSLITVSFAATAYFIFGQKSNNDNNAQSDRNDKSLLNNQSNTDNDQVKKSIYSKDVKESQSKQVIIDNSHNIDNFNITIAKNKFLQALKFKKHLNNEKVITVDEVQPDEVEQIYEGDLIEQEDNQNLVDETIETAQSIEPLLLTDAYVELIDLVVTVIVTPVVQPAPTPPRTYDYTDSQAYAHAHNQRIQDELSHP